MQTRLRRRQANRFKKVKPLLGIQLLPRFVPVDSKTIEASELSSSLTKKIFVVMRNVETMSVDCNALRISSVIACSCDGE